MTGIIPEEKSPTAKYQLTLCTTQYETDKLSLFTENTNIVLGQELDDGEPVMMKLTTEAEVKIEDGRFTVTYDETEATGLEGSRTSITFLENEPNLVSIIRSGSFRTAIVVEERKHHTCVYETPYMPFEVCTYGRRVDNALTLDGGYLYIDYVVEIKGGLAQHTELDVSLRKL